MAAFKITEADAQKLFKALHITGTDANDFVAMQRKARNPKSKKTTTIDYIIPNFGTELKPVTNPDGTPKMVNGIQETEAVATFAHIGEFFQEVFDIAGSKEPVEFTERVPVFYSEDKVITVDGKEITHKKGDPILNDKGEQETQKVTRQKDRRWAVAERLGLLKIFEEGYTVASKQNPFDFNLFVTPLISGARERGESISSLEEQRAKLMAELFALDELNRLIIKNRADNVSPVLPPDAAASLGLPESVTFREPEDVATYMTQRRAVYLALQAQITEKHAELAKKEEDKAKAEAVKAGTHVVAA